MPMHAWIKTLHSATCAPIPSSCVAIAGEAPMTAWICRTCGVEHADTSAPLAVCRICSDERQYVLPTGQQWTTLEELSTEGRRGAVEDVEIGLFGVTVTPKSRHRATRLASANPVRELVVGPHWIRR